MMALMTNWRYKQCLKLIDQLEESENELYDAVENLLWRMHEICAEQGLMKKLTKKQRNSLYFNLDGLFDSISEDFIYLTDFHHDYGDVIAWGINWTAQLPASWLWRKNWEQEFITEWIEEWKVDQKEHEEEFRQKELKEYERLKRKIGRDKQIANKEKK